MDKNLRHFKFTRLRLAFSRFFTSSNPDRKPYFYIPNARSPRGSALVMAAIFMLVATTLITVGVKLAANARKEAKQQAVVLAEAENAARAGLVDAIGWFRRQPIQPVSATTLFGPTPQPTPTFTAPVSFIDQVFNPYYNTTAPNSTDTLDGSTTIGIVNEFSPDGAGSVAEAAGDEVIWQRYEVQKQLGSAATLMPNAVHDITGQRVDQKFNGQGLVWYIQSTGYVYKRTNYTKSVSAPTTWATPYNAGTNKVLAKAVLGTEIRKMSLSMPWGVGSALYCKDITKVRLTSGSNSSLSNGGKTGTYAWASASPLVCTAKPVGATSSNVQVGVPVTCTNNYTPLIDAQVFGMTAKEILGVADVIGSASTTVNFAGMRTGSWQLIYFGGNLTIDPASAAPEYQSLNGSGILVVNGDLYMKSAGTTFSSFNGLIYVTGNFTNIGCLINGGVIMGYTGNSSSSGNVTVTGSSGYQGLIQYNPNVVRQLQSVVAQYREDISARRNILAIPNI